MERAIADLTRAIKLNPDNVDALNARGDAHHHMRQYDAAANDYMRAMRLGRPDHDPAVDLYWYELRDVSDLFDQRGFDFWRDNQCGRAIEEFDEAIKIDPTHPTARNLRADCEIEEGRYDRAEDDLNKVVELAKSAPQGDLIEALGYRCIERAAAGDLPPAIEECNAGLKLSPHDGKSLRGRALAYLKMQAFDLAIADYDEALKSEPKTAELLYGRGLARQARGDIVGAEKDIEAANEISPSIAALFKRYGVPETQSRHE